MLLKHLDQVAEIDDMINQIHDELADLYRERSVLMGGKITASPKFHKVIAAKQNDWMTDQYQALKATWKQYDVTVPAYATLKTRLQKARKAIAKLEAAKPDWKDQLEVVLVPPTNKLSFPLEDKVRLQQTGVTTPDYVDTVLKAPKSSSKWRVLVVYSANEAVYMGSSEMMLDAKNRKVAGYDVTKLGLAEYAAFSLQQTAPVDTQTWTILPKERVGDSQVACVAYVDGQYRFDIDDINDVFGDNRFRPAIEIAP